MHFSPNNLSIDHLYHNSIWTTAYPAVEYFALQFHDSGKRWQTLYRTLHGVKDANNYKEWLIENSIPWLRDVPTRIVKETITVTVLE